MKLLFMLLLVSCGMSEVGTQGVAQIKRVHNVTPLICSNHLVLDASLGVMVNGVGSMSTDDILVEADANQAQELNNAAKAGKLVKITYDTRRFTWCVPEKLLKNIEVIQ
jgi:hypothetical protein